MKRDSLRDQYRINERIRPREVRVVGENVEQGIYPIAEALKMAREQGLDLIDRKSVV
jgi:translation initiation factor IF-3